MKRRDTWYELPRDKPWVQHLFHKSNDEANLSLLLSVFRFETGNEWNPKCTISCKWLPGSKTVLFVLFYCKVHSFSLMNMSPVSTLQNALVHVNLLFISRLGLLCFVMSTCMTIFHWTNMCVVFAHFPEVRYWPRKCTRFQLW